MYKLHLLLLGTNSSCFVTTRPIMTTEMSCPVLSLSSITQWYFYINFPRKIIFLFLWDLGLFKRLDFVDVSSKSKATAKTTVCIVRIFTPMLPNPYFAMV